jgi:hypothetical protein
MTGPLEPDQVTGMGDADADAAELLLDVKTAAKLLAISSATLRRLSDSGLALTLPGSSDTGVELKWSVIS